ncbi:MAG: hypothetical protein JXR46_06610 [Calditrichaceae bacterium]|nr:hypothetical protein [Calditrichaceae bacterium]MBN2708700.1 hypothetical protein [Calditrichaceae bacterium]RQV92812.1 MAG: hypothetical protein EH224_14300 [Calditrichota bacterium]
MEFLIVPILFGLALFMLSIGKLFGRHGIKEKCKHGHGGHKEGSCGASSPNDLKLPLGKKDDGMENVAKLGNPQRNRRFSDKFDFRPERLN